MFGKNKNKKNNKDIAIEEPTVFNAHTMSDDLNNDSIEIEASNTDTDEKTKLNSNSNEGSPFLNISNTNTNFKSGDNKKSDSGEYFSKKKEIFSAHDSSSINKSETIQPSGQVKDFDSKKVNDNDDNNDNHKKNMKKALSETNLSSLKELATKREKNNYSVDNMDKNKNNERKTHKILYITIGLVLLIIGIGISGSVYFLRNSNIDLTNKILTLFKKDIGNEKQPSNNANISDNTNIPENQKNDDKVEFSDKTNFLVISSDNFNKEGITSAINQTFSKMSDNDRILEFVVVDRDNVPIAFTEFTGTFGIDLPSEILEKLDNDFSIFLYKESGDGKRISIAVKIADKRLSMNTVKNNENALIDGINPLFLGVDIPKNETKQFGNSSYKGISIRFINLKQNSNLSVDYAIVNNYLMIATSKKIDRLTIAKLLSEESITSDESIETVIEVE